MNKNRFFKPTAIYNEFMILDLIETHNNITQRTMSNALDVSVSTINSYLDKYEQEGYLLRKYKNSKIVSYKVTKRGIERKRALNIGFLKDTRLVYYLAKKNVNDFLAKIVDDGFEEIIMYGAGEVAEIFLETLKFDNYYNISIKGIIDDNPDKLSQNILGNTINDISILNTMKYDGVLISSYTNQDMIETKLLENNIKKEKIIKFFA